MGYMYDYVVGLMCYSDYEGLNIPDLYIALVRCREIFMFGCARGSGSCLCRVLVVQAPLKPWSKSSGVRMTDGNPGFGASR